MLTDGEFVSVPRAPGARSRIADLQCHVAARRYIAEHGGQGEIVGGWAIERYWDKDVALEVTFHSVVRLRDGSLADPHCDSGTLLFLPDPHRHFDFDRMSGYNNVVLGAQALHCPWTEDSLPAGVLLYAWRGKDRVFLSADPRHETWTNVTDNAGAVTALQALGLEPTWRNVMMGTNAKPPAALFSKPGAILDERFVKGPDPRIAGAVAQVAGLGWQ